MPLQPSHPYIPSINHGQAHNGLIVATHSHARALPSTVDISRSRSLHLTRPSRSVNSFHTLSGVALMAWSLSPVLWMSPFLS